MTGVVGVLLAAGAGTRMGAPKALVRDAASRPWVVTAARALSDGGCDPVLVVVGARSDEVRAALVDEDVEVIDAPDWATGMGASLRAGVRTAAHLDADAAIIHLVDVPDVGAEVVRRLCAQATPDVLARAGYGPRTHGHPVLIGREHWVGVAGSAHGDSGARAYFCDHPVTVIECADLAAGVDVDRVEDLPVGSAVPKLSA
jgi:CTP:molybdopterin cytidylyltransferase MocA